MLYYTRNERKMILVWITLINNNKSIKIVLLYRSSSYGDNCSSFHSKNDNIGSTIIFFIHNYAGYELGAYTNFF